MKSKKLQGGYTILFSVIVLGAVGLTLAISLSTLSRASILTSSAFTNSNQAKALANACAETALQQIRNNPSFSGTGNLSLGEGDCIYTVANLGGDNREITASGTIGDIIRKVKVSINTINPQINISSWQEVNDF